jgi:hypothetical protein
VEIVHASFFLPIFLLYSELLCFFFVCFVSLWKDFFNLLAVCSNVEFVFCWCVLTIYISGSSLLSTYSTKLRVSAM